MSKLQNLTGKTFGILTVISKDANDHKNRTKWICSCRCGITISINASNLKRGHSKSCGCMRSVVAKRMFSKHGDRRTKEYQTWCGIKNRVFNQSLPRWSDYGGRGIKMHPNWIHDYESFLADVGRSPSPDHSLDRIDNNGNYEPGNVRWATRFEQGSNKRNNIVFDYLGQRFTLAELSRKTGISVGSLRNRLIKYNWPLDKALTKSTKEYHNRK